MVIKRTGLLAIAVATIRSTSDVKDRGNGLESNEVKEQLVWKRQKGKKTAHWNEIDFLEEINVNGFLQKKLQVEILNSY